MRTLEGRDKAAEDDDQPQQRPCTQTTGQDDPGQAEGGLLLGADAHQAFLGDAALHVLGGVPPLPPLPQGGQILVLHIPTRFHLARPLD